MPGTDDTEQKGCCSMDPPITNNNIDRDDGDGDGDCDDDDSDGHVIYNEVIYLAPFQVLYFDYSI